MDYFLPSWISPYFQELIHPLYKYLLHVLTQRCEIERICGDYDQGRHTNRMTIAFSSSIKHSKQLKHPQLLLFHQPYTEHNQLYTITSIYEEIIQIKHMENIQSLTSANMKTCLKSLRLINAMKISLNNLKNTKFNYAQPEHVELLEKLWKHLKPNIRRKENTLITQEWTELGFQNKDPSSDFRGMGLLGLIQLVYLSEFSMKDAIDLLNHSQYDHSFFPFAATGINITAYVLELLEKTHLHQHIIKQMDRILLQDTMNSIEGCSDDEKCVKFALDVVHEFYAKIFLLFGKTWIAAKPRDVMEFPRIFKQFKLMIEEEYPSL